MIDLEELAQQADATSEEPVSVSRRYLAQLHTEVMNGRVAQAQLDMIFGPGRKPGECR
tara:strand:- start:166 stop:339 length:174 start_codon:yes stop_codon:yes gene_type:complete